MGDLVPAAVVAVCVPWPSLSRARSGKSSPPTTALYVSRKGYPPTNLLLQAKTSTARGQRVVPEGAADRRPIGRVGAGGRAGLAARLGCSGHTPVSSPPNEHPGAGVALPAELVPQRRRTDEVVAGVGQDVLEAVVLHGDDTRDGEHGLDRVGRDEGADAAVHETEAAAHLRLRHRRWSLVTSEASRPWVYGAGGDVGRRERLAGDRGLVAGIVATRRRSWRSRRSRV